MTAAAHCGDCGALLDAFGACPQADPKDAVRMSKPVNCGKPPLGGGYERAEEEGEKAWHSARMRLFAENIGAILSEIPAAEK